MPRQDEHLEHPGEPRSNAIRATLSIVEPRAQRTRTPSLAVIEKSSGIYHWTADGRRLCDFTSGVLVANLGHNPPAWMERWFGYMGWGTGVESPLPLTSYNAATEIEIQTSQRLLEALQACPGGGRLERVLWAASGSEAIQKALWVCLARDPERDFILATRHGFHGKKGLANAVTGSEKDSERDPRVLFISFPMSEYRDVSFREVEFDPTQYQKELTQLWQVHGPRIGTLITEPYLGAAGSFHPPHAYLQMLQSFCREHDIYFVLDEVQSNFGRTKDLFAFTAYGLEPDIVVLGKSLANGVPVAAVAGRADVFKALDYGQGSDTWSGNPLACAAALATLESFEDPAILANARKASDVLESGLVRLKKLPFVGYVRGERGGMVWGVETVAHSGQSAECWADAIVRACYYGQSNEGVHLLGPLARTVIRIAPPLTITPEQARDALELMHNCLVRLAERSVGTGS
jgi:4-aminobutyrate aminotransferase-like enzyme